MIPALIIWLFKKYATPLLNRRRQNKKYTSLRSVKTVTAVMLMMLTLSLPLFAQEQTVKYNVLKGNKVVGCLDLYKKRNGNNLYLKMISEVKVKFIFSINVFCNEESLFQDGKLMSSHVLRKVNGKEKANRQTLAADEGYKTIAEGKSGILNATTINNNLMLLYCCEPKDNAQVYSDNFQQFLRVKQTGDHVYRIDLPDGNYNYYSYTNGICSKVDIHHSLYTIQIKLV
ncbi:DUF6134 family protein [Mucilaginibacter segetis]|uniref:Uncharacterized protein n=1 Tax=Mucilaginibacter segetis TaxID=2793071 RepID=A0A934PRR6_9SPHI|nr:DUF6134 family protein [Mucilaginibacter segetis]MBK0377840.1 hypothetical protein [Mucilaginibacter segetis]